MANKDRLNVISSKISTLEAILQEKQEVLNNAAETLLPLRDKIPERYGGFLDALSRYKEANRSGEMNRSDKEVPVSLGSSAVKINPSPLSSERQLDTPSSEDPLLSSSTDETTRGYELVFPPSTDSGARDNDDAHVEGDRATSEVDSGSSESEAASMVPRSYFVMPCVCCRVRTFAVSFQRDLPGVMIAGATERDGIAIHCCQACWIDKHQAVVDNLGRKCDSPASVLQGASQLFNPILWERAMYEMTGSMVGRDVTLLRDRKGAMAAVDAKTVYKQLVAGEYMCSIPPGQSDGLERLEFWKYGLQGGVM